MTYSYLVEDLYHTIQIQLNREHSTPVPVIKVYRNGSSTVAQTVVYSSQNDDGYLYLINLNNGTYQIGDELTFRITYSTSTVNIAKTYEGVTVLLNGEEVADSPIRQNTFEFTPNDTGEYDLEFVYKGNNATKMASTGVTTFHVGQEVVESQGEITSGEYTLEFVGSPAKTIAYDDGTKYRLVLKRGGHPVSGEVIQKDTPVTSPSEETDANGQVRIVNSKWAVGKYKIGGRFLSSNNEIQKTVYIDVTVEKSTPIIASDIAVTTPKNSKIKFKVKTIAGTEIAGENVTLYVNGNKVTKKTNDNGNVYVKVTKEGIYEIRAVYKGNANLKKVSETFSTIVVTSPIAESLVGD